MLVRWSRRVSLQHDVFRTETDLSDEDHDDAVVLLGGAELGHQRAERVRQVGVDLPLHAGDAHHYRDCTQRRHQDSPVPQLGVTGTVTGTDRGLFIKSEYQTTEIMLQNSYVILNNTPGFCFKIFMQVGSTTLPENRKSQDIKPEMCLFSACNKSADGRCLMEISYSQSFYTFPTNHSSYDELHSFTGMNVRRFSISWFIQTDFSGVDKEPPSLCL